MKTVKVRNTVIGEGMPKICVPIVGITKEAILEEARAITKLPADVVEWRIDWFENVFEREGIDSVIYKVSEKMTDDGRYYHDIAADLGVKICSFAEDTDLSPYDIVVDCILGTGFRGDVRGLAADAIKAVNESNAYVISVDINSGMNGDTGEASTAVRSDLTVSIGYYKQGLFRGQAEEYIGKLVNTDIGIVLI